MHRSGLESDEDKPFYRGGLDDQRGVAPNGAIANSTYIDLLQETWGKPQILTPIEGVHTVVGYQIANVTVIEGETGLILFDTGSSIGQGQELLKMIRTFSDKPVAAIIYGHHHYTGGAKAFVEAGTDVKIFAHPDVEANLAKTSGLLGPMQLRRIGRQLGSYLPAEGPDAVISVPEPHFDDPHLNASGHIPANHPVKNEEEIVVNGIRIKFHYAVADTRDSLIVYFPDKNMIVANTAVTNFLFSLYTLRGDFYRDPTDLIASIDLIRKIRPEVYIPTHGKPMVGKEKIYAIATAHRDAYAFLYNQSVRAINRGLTPDEMVETIHLPKHLRDNPILAPIYVDPEYIIRGFYGGIVGWFAEDTADLHPPAPQEMGMVMIEGFGGEEKIRQRAQQAFDNKQYNLAATLLSFILDVDSENLEARKLKAKSLRAMAQATKAGTQTRNFMLTHALHLENQLDWNKPPKHSLLPPPTYEQLLASPPEVFLKLLEVKIDPNKSADLEKTVAFHFTDIGKQYGIAIRRGVAEFLGEYDGNVDITIELTKENWADILSGKRSLANAINEDNVSVSGEKRDAQRVAEAFD